MLWQYVGQPAKKKKLFTVKSHILKAIQYESIPAFLLLHFCFMTGQVHFLACVFLTFYLICNYIASRLDSQCFLASVEHMKH